MGGCFGLDPASLKDIPYKSKAGDDFCGSVKVRSETDRPFKLVLLGCVGLLGILVFYCSLNGDIDREFKGYDNCGNVCGVNNEKETDPQFACKGEDMTNKDLLQLSPPEDGIEKIKYRRCVARCDPSYFQVIDVCLPKPYNDGREGGGVTTADVQGWLEEAWEDVKLVRVQIFQLCSFALVLSLIIVYLLRTQPGFIVWLLLIAPTLVCAFATFCLWAAYSESKDEMPRTNAIENETSFLFAASVVMTGVSIVIIAMILIMRKRIKLVVRLFKEAGKAIEDMPLLLVQPMVTFLALFILAVFFIFIEILIKSGGFLTKNPLNGDIYYKKDFVMRFASWYDLFIWYWLVQFCIGCQHMIIAGSVASWFFTRDKMQLRSPIRSAFLNLTSYHLGTVALGSLVLAVVQLLRTILSSIKSQMKNSKNPLIRIVYMMIKSIFDIFESLLKFWTRNAYIQVAMFGTSFCEGGKQAFHVLISNAYRVAAINSVGDFVLFLAKVLVVACTNFIGFTLMNGNVALNSMTVPLILVGSVSFFIIHCFLSVYEMVIDTIFMCFCEDCEINDGESRPYFMSKGLMEFVEYSNQKYLVPKAATTNA